jgi:NADH-quinone oxidoreductase subunit C
VPRKLQGELDAIMAPLSFEQIHQSIATRFGEAIGPLQPMKKDPYCTFAAPRLLEICRYLQTDPDLWFDFLEDLTATDHPKENLIRVVYHFYSYRHRHSFIAKVLVDRQNPELDSLESIWKAANWMEREVYDLFGVKFLGHSDLRRVLMPDDWIGSPLRKDYSEAGGYRDITNVRDNPLDLYLGMDRQIRAEAPHPAPTAPAAKQSPPGPSATPPGPAPAAAKLDPKAGA